jgi:hypothetical protein
MENQVVENQVATNYVVFAVGGTGAKVAEAMIDLLCLGMPMAVVPQGVGLASLNAADKLTVVRIDPDKACRSASLQEAVSRYQDMVRIGGKGASRGLWSLQLNDLLTIHPMDALSGPPGVETLEAKLASNEAERVTALRLLRLFYNDADLVTSLDRGFFQKPFIGAAVIASMGERKREADAPLVDFLKTFAGQRLRIFVVGSMYGGTGAAGLPVLSKIVKQVAEANREKDNWQVAGCLLAPYFYPPEPPLREIDWGNDWRPDTGEAFADFLTRSGLDEAAYLEGVRERNAGRGLAAPGQDFTYEEIRQLARGYYAKPDEIDRRAVASWDYYQSHGADLFDELYLLGLRNPTRYGAVELSAEDYQGDPHFSPRIRWSNGGLHQVSPLHAVEFAAAGLGLHFFTRTGAQEKGTRLLGVHHHESAIGDALCWADLALHPSVRPDRWLYTALVGYNWLKFNLIPYIASRQMFENAAPYLRALHRFVDAEHFEKFRDDLNALAKHLGDALQHTTRALGWEEQETARLMRGWLHNRIRFAATGRLLRRKPASYPFAAWRLEGVDTEAIGKSVPVSSQLAGLRGVAGDDHQPLGIAYLQSLWNYIAGHMTAVKEGAVGN